MRITEIILLTCLTSLGGCASINSNNTDKSTIVKLISSKHISVKSANINFKPDSISISGRLKRKYATDSWRLPGHVDVKIVNREGTVLFTAKSKYSKNSNLRTIRNFRYSYEVTIPFIPSDSDIIYVIFHET